jgi:hypothetical protein
MGYNLLKFRLHDISILAASSMLFIQLYLLCVTGEEKVIHVFLIHSLPFVALNTPGQMTFRWLNGSVFCTLLMRGSSNGQPDGSVIRHCGNKETMLLNFPNFRSWKENCITMFLDLFMGAGKGNGGPGICPKMERNRI